MHNTAQQVGYNKQEADRFAQELLSGWTQLKLAGGKLAQEDEPTIQCAFDDRQTRRTADNRRRHNVLDSEMEAAETKSLDRFMEVARSSGIVARLAAR